MIYRSTPSPSTNVPETEDDLDAAFESFVRFNERDFEREIDEQAALFPDSCVPPELNVENILEDLGVLSVEAPTTPPVTGWAVRSEEQELELPLKRQVSFVSEETLVDKKARTDDSIKLK